ncbi:MAG: DUF3014 domain-containing protein [Vicinamibacterales bacterium]
MNDQAKPPIIPIAIIGGLIILGILLGAWWMSRKPGTTVATTKAVVSTEAPITTTPPPPLPPLDQMDPMMRNLLGALSKHPELAKWLATDSLVRQLAMAIDAASQGKSPSRNFKVVAPASSFAIARRNNRRVIDPASYKRYNALVGAVTSMDASGVAKVYQTIKPRLNEAYRNNGHPDGDVDRALQAALQTLLETPILKDPIAVTEGKGARWEFDDPHVEALTASQKQLLRMGPEHVEAMLVWLRALKAGLGS